MAASLLCCGDAFVLQEPKTAPWKKPGGALLLKSTQPWEEMPIINNQYSQIHTNSGPPPVYELNEFGVQTEGDAANDYFIIY